jgi:hypothetical protein
MFHFSSRAWQLGGRSRYCRFHRAAGSGRTHFGNPDSRDA